VSDPKSQAEQLNAAARNFAGWIAEELFRRLEPRFEAARAESVTTVEVWLSTKDVAEQLNVAPKTVRAWIKSKSIEAEMVQREWRIRQSELQRFVTSSRQTRERSAEEIVDGILGEESK